jgi:hypothetical protein
MPLSWGDLVLVSSAGPRWDPARRATEKPGIEQHYPDAPTPEEALDG